VFTIAIAAVMADLTAVSTSGGTEIALISVLAVASVALFVWQERRSPEPMISLKLWGRRPIAAANGASLLTGMTMIGLTTFLPVYVQGVMQKSALAAGFALSVMVLGWPIGATLAARLYTRFGIRPVLLTGGMLVPVGSFAFVALQPDTSPVLAGIGSWIVGFGMGLLSSASLVLIQEIVDWSERGSATASFIFARSLGSTFGATIFGAVLNYGLIHSGTGAVSSEELRRLLENATRGATTGAPLRLALEQSLHVTFVAMFVIALLAAASAFFVPKIAIGQRRVAAESDRRLSAERAPSIAE
jgi:MFS family permease